MAIECGICPNKLSGRVVETTCGHKAHEACYFGKSKLFKEARGTRLKASEVAGYCFHTHCKHYHRKNTPLWKAPTMEELRKKVTVITLPEAVVEGVVPPEPQLQAEPSQGSQDAATSQAQLPQPTSAQTPVVPPQMQQQPLKPSSASVATQTDSEEPPVVTPAPIQPQPLNPVPAAQQPQPPAPQVPLQPEVAPVHQVPYTPFWVTPIKIAIDISLVVSISFVAVFVFQTFTAFFGAIVLGIFAMKMVVNPWITRLFTVE